MTEQLPLRKYVKVWVMRRKNNPRKDGKAATVSYTLQWVLFGEKSVMSLGPGSTLAYARRMAAEKEKELNDPDHAGYLEPIRWDDFRKKYLDLLYPAHDLKGAERKEAARKWSKSLATMLRERAALDGFERAVFRRKGQLEDGSLRSANPWCHEIPVTCRESFINGRLAEVGSAATVDSDLGTLRYFFGLMDEWNHRPKNANPFTGKGKSSVGRRRRDVENEQADEKDTGYYTLAEVQALLRQADKEVVENPGDWNRKRLRALIYFMAYTGCRIKEALHLDWDKDVNWDAGVVWLRHKRGNRLKTAASAAPVGLPDALIRVLREWEKDRTCAWVFPNASRKPWITAGPGYKHLDQLKALAKRAGIGQATWKMFRHAFSTHGKQRFGMTKEQVQAQLRHTSTDTQKHYDHDDLANLRDAVSGVDFQQ